YRQLASLGGPLLAGSRLSPTPQRGQGDALAGASGSAWGLDPTGFGRHPFDATLDAASLCVRAPSVVEVRLPADLVAGSELVTSALLHRESGAEGPVQVQVLTTKPGLRAALQPGLPILANEDSATRRRVTTAMDEFR